MKHSHNYTCWKQLLQSQPPAITAMYIEVSIQYSGTSMYIVSVYGYADPSVLWNLHVYSKCVRLC